jgi:ATP-dependent DNA helicase RecQ
MENIIFFDLEVKRNSSHIKDIGAVFNGEEFHGTSVVKFGHFLLKSGLLCGHNIIGHDIPVLELSNLKQALSGKLFIDTLYLSALLFAEKPYHHLVKDYKLFDDNSEINNPLADSRLCQTLLFDEIAKFNSFNPELKAIFFTLLKNEKPFNGFFQIVQAETCMNLTRSIRDYFDGRMCKNVTFENWTHEPVNLAFALAMINTENNESILPKWIVMQHPEVNEIVNEFRFSNCRDITCSYCNKKLDSHKGLSRYFGYDDFRKFSEEEKTPLQQQVVESSLKSESLIAVFPTGGGKSLTFQLPALIQGEATRSLTVVISPLQSLMKDQIDVLEKRHGITRAVTINGLLSPLERMQAIERVSEGSAHILYISPESLRSGTITKIFTSRTIARFVIDEAHCFSSWGHDFRVDYLYIGEFIKDLQARKGLEKSIPVSCFTATAKPSVIIDIRQYFYQRLGLELLTYIAPLKRENLHYGVYVAEDDNDKYQKLIQLLFTGSEPAIIYVSRTRAVEDLALKLREDGFLALPYHGKMERDARISNQNKFMNGEVDIIVATSAFGMGVDKENVQMVVHYDLSESLENYIQEAGRAGRSPEINANCVILFDKNDLNKHFNLYYHARLNFKEISQVWRGIKSLSKTRKKISQSALEIAKASGWDSEIQELETKIKTSIAVLEESRYLKRGLDSPRIFANSLLVKNYNAAVEILQSATDITPEQILDSTRILQRLIKEDETRVDYLSDVLGIKRDVVEQMIRMMRHKGILGDAKDLTAFVEAGNSTNYSVKTARLYFKIERNLLNVLNCEKKLIYLKEINEILIEKGITQSTPDKILDILRFWEIKGFIKKDRMDQRTSAFQIIYRKELASFIENLERRQKLAGLILKYLLIKYKGSLALKPAEIQNKPVEFSIVELKTEVEKSQGIFNETFSLSDYERALLFLNHISAIKLDKGFIILYRPMTIEKRVSDHRIKFKKEDYQKLADFYQAKIEQIHIIGEYASKMLKDYKGALIFADEYFKLPYDQFVDKYFRERRDQIRKPLTPEKFEKVFGNLSPEQLKIIRDNKNNFVLVTAGPGSGKTLVLVHKIASVLMMEDVKPEQFLMLTFSRAASLEFKSRLKKLVGGIAGYIDIFTYHSYCFHVSGRIGTLEKSENIIRETINRIESGEIPAEKIANKSMLVLDEFQDVSQEEYLLIKTIIKHAENIRVIAVGDDDQNIYGFRGSSIEYMMNFKNDFHAKQYNLNRNFRSKSKLVNFSNKYVKSIQNRLKKGNLFSNANKGGNIKIFHYKTSNIIIPVINNLKNITLSGSSAIMSRTNEEAVIVNSLMKNTGKKSKLILSNDSFRIKDLQEIRLFSEQICRNTERNMGIISEDDWQNGLSRLHVQFEYSANYALTLSIINHFSKTANKKLKTEWLTFISEMQLENFIHPENDSFLVSTMHKAKGKEFDNVILLLKDFNDENDDDKRLLYVALTRARNNILIHLNNDIFHNLMFDGIEKHNDENDYGEPEELEFHLTHRDIDLGLHTLDGVAHSVSNLLAGVKLILSDNKFHLKTETGRVVTRFSRDFGQKLNRWFLKGYQFHDAYIHYIVYWKERDNQNEYRVVLPVVRLKK